MAEKTEEYDPLYTSRSSGDKSESDYDDDAEMKSLAQRSRRSSRWQRLRPWALHLGLPLLYTAMFLGSVYSRPAAGTFSLLDCEFPLEKVKAFPTERSASSFETNSVAEILTPAIGSTGKVHWREDPSRGVPARGQGHGAVHG